MKQRKDGGEAFPCPSTLYPDGTVHEIGSIGLSKRDYFAAKAIQGLLANPGGPIQANGMNGWNWCNCSYEDVVDLAYSIADAMLAARENT